MVSMGTYYTWNVVVPAALSGVLWLVIFLLMLAAVPLVRNVPRILVEMLQLSLTDMDCSDAACHRVKVDGQKIKKKALKVLILLVIPLTVVTIFFSFWNVWLVEEEASETCLPNFDCFPVQEGRVLQDTPVETCPWSFNASMLSDNQNTTAAVDLNDTAELAADQISYRCYRFVFLYAEGIGAAGGILFFTAVFSKLYFCLLVAIITTDGLRYLRLGALIFVWVFAAVVWVLFIVVNAATPIIREAVFQTQTDTIQFVLYAVNFAAVVVGGYVVSAGVIFV